SWKAREREGLTVARRACDACRESSPTPPGRPRGSPCAHEYARGSTGARVTSERIGDVDPDQGQRRGVVIGFSGRAGRGDGASPTAPRRQAFTPRGGRPGVRGAWF